MIVGTKCQSHHPERAFPSVGSLLMPMWACQGHASWLCVVRFLGYGLSQGRLEMTESSGLTRCENLYYISQCSGLLHPLGTVQQESASLQVHFCIGSGGT